MGWFLPSHVDQGAIFGLLGVWHMYNTLQNYVRAPNSFRTMTWFPAHGRFMPKRLRCLELWVLLFIVVVFIGKQLSHAQSDFAAGMIQFAHLQRFQHVIFALFFLVYVSSGLICEYTSLLPLPSGALHCTFASGFLMELVVFHYGHHPGDDLESFVHMLMQIILLLVVLLMFMEVQRPRSILVAVARCMMLIFKGTWFFQIGLLINFPYHTPLGCTKDENHEYPVCPTHESELRAKSLQVLIFNLQFLSIMVGTFVGYAILMYQSKQLTTTPRPILPNIITPRSILTPRTREKNASVYFAVPEEGHDTSGESEGEEVLDAHGTGIKSLSRRSSSRKPQAHEGKAQSP